MDGWVALFPRSAGSWLTSPFAGGFNPTKGALGHLARHCHPAAESRSGTCRGRPEVGLRLKSALSGEGYFALVLAMERRQWRDAGPSQFDPSKPALGPTEAPKAAVRYVRSTSISLKNPVFGRARYG